MMTLDKLRETLTTKGYTNLRVETARACYIMADKDGKTFTYYPEFCDEDSVR